jgi:hypothetical protein
MTDFLTRLAERTLGLTPPVQPLLASRHATGPATPVFPDILGEEQDLVVERPADPTQTPTPQSREDALYTVESVLPRGLSDTHKLVDRTFPNFEKAAGLDTQEPIPPRAVSTTLDSFSTTGLAAASADTDASSSAESLRGNQRQPVQAPSEASPDRQPDTTFSNLLSVPAALDGVVEATPSARRHEESHAAPPLLSSVPQGHLESMRNGRGVFDQPVVERGARRNEVVRPQVTAIAGHGEPISSVNESGPPVIRVTIGRIEVRAILPPTSAAERPAPARAGPPVSLDEYLKQRNEGQR